MLVFRLLALGREVVAPCDAALTISLITIKYNQMVSIISALELVIIIAGIVVVIIDLVCVLSCSFCFYLFFSLFWTPICWCQLSFSFLFFSISVFFCCLFIFFFLLTQFWSQLCFCVANARRSRAFLFTRLCNCFDLKWDFFHFLQLTAALAGIPAFLFFSFLFFSISFSVTKLLWKQFFFSNHLFVDYTCDLRPKLLAGECIRKHIFVLKLFIIILFEAKKNNEKYVVTSKCWKSSNQIPNWNFLAALLPYKFNLSPTEAFTRPK